MGTAKSDHLTGEQKTQTKTAIQDAANAGAGVAVNGQADAQQEAGRYLSAPLGTAKPGVVSGGAGSGSSVSSGASASTMSSAAKALSADEVLTELRNNPSTYHQNPAALTELIQRTSVETGGKLTVYYGGEMGAVHTSQVIGALKANPDVRVIDKTELADLLTRSEFQKELAKAFDTTVDNLENRSDPANKFLFDAKQGQWALGSERFSGATVGPSIALSVEANPERTFTQVELSNMLKNPEPHNGVPKEIFVNIYETSLAKYQANPATAGQAVEHALLEVNKAAAASSLMVTKDFQYGYVGDKLVLDTTPLSKYVSDIKVEALPTAAGGVRDFGVVAKYQQGFSAFADPEGIAEGFKSMENAARTLATQDFATATGAGATQAVVALTKVANAAGYMGIALEANDALNRATRAANEGDFAKAAEITTTATAKIMGAINGAVIGAEVTAASTWQLEFVPYIGPALHGLVTLAGAGVGAYYGHGTPEKLQELMHKADAWLREQGGSDAIVGDPAGTGAESILGVSTVSSIGTPGKLDYNFPNVAGAGRGTVNPELVSPAEPRPGSSTFVGTVDATHVTLKPGGTLSDIVLLQNKAGNPITADDLRSANPELGINPDCTNVPAGASLQIPQRVGDNLVTTTAAGSTQSNNTKTGETVTLTHNADGSTTQTTSSADEFGRTVRTVTWDANEQITADQTYSINTLDNTQTLIATGTPATPILTDPDPSDARFSRYPDTSGASADNDTTPQPPPITEPSATYDPSDHHFTNYAAPAADLHPLTQDLGLASTLIGLKNWSQQTDLGKLGTAVGLYNTLNTYGLSSEAIASGATNNLGLGSLNTLGSGLGLVQALQSGNPISIASSGGSFYNSIVGSGSVNAIPIPVLNALNIAGALQSGNPLSIASSVAACFPPYGTVISLCLSVFGGLMGNHAPPPPPDGLVSYQLGEDGSITIQTEHNVSGGADSAHSTAGSLLGILQSVIDANNGQAPGDASTQLAIDPSRLPQVGFTAGTSWIAITQADGSTSKETVHPENIGQRLIELATQNDAIVPQWQVQTLLAHQQAHSAEQKAQAQDNAEAATTAQGPTSWEGDASTPTATSAANPATPNADDFAPASSAPPPSTTPRFDASAVGIQGQALESADHKTQTVSALVLRLDTPEAQAHISALAQLKPNPAGPDTAAQATSEVYRDVDGDGFLESTQWVSTLDAQGNAQGMLVLDANANGQIETADILHLGGNAAERNSLAWLDANGDGKLDASDPAFAAIKLWVDVNHDGIMQAAENTTLQTLQLTSIDLQAGSLTYEGGQTQTLTATTLAADTEGVQLGTVYGVGEDGQLQDLKTGELLVYEHYDGKDRSIRYELNAKSTGDWEGTAEAAQHRHGGGNVAGAPTQTTATGATSTGEVRAKANVTTASTIGVGDARMLSDAPQERPKVITVQVGDARIHSLSSTNTPSTERITFVPAGVREGWMTADGKEHLRLPPDSLFGATGLGALAAVGLGAVPQTAFAKAEPGDTGFNWQSAPSAVAPDTARAYYHPTPSGYANPDAASTRDATSTINLDNFAVVRQVRLGVGSSAVPDLPGPRIHPPLHRSPAPFDETAWTPWNNATTGSAGAWHPPAPGESTLSRPYIAPRRPGTTVVAPPPSTEPLPTSTTPSTTPGTTTPPTGTTAPSNPTALAPPVAPPSPVVVPTTPAGPTVDTSAKTGDDQLSDPQEDRALRVPFSVLLANDANAQTITQVGNAQHGTVSIQGGEVVFTPDANYHGAASFAYLVSAQDGSQAAGVASFTITAVNDTPVGQDDSANGTEDTVLTLSAASLLGNDTDVDMATDNQTLRIGAVGAATHGTVNLLPNGSVQFTPDANFHGKAGFDYLVDDGQGGQSKAHVTLQVGAVNDVPVAVGETIAASEDTTLLVTQAALLANDTDADTTTDAQTLSISTVANATHGTVSILGNGQIQFVPDANYNGNASFDYTVSDGKGGSATTTAFVQVGAVADAPVASGETINGQEDQTLTITAASLLQNETDADNPLSSLKVSRVANASGGTVSINGSGDVVFAPNANHTGAAGFTYWVKDPDGQESNPATVTVNLAAVNDAPYAQGETVYGASEDAVFHIDRSTLVANDGDVDDGNGGLQIVLTGAAPQHGTVTVDGSGNVVYTPTANYYGTDRFDYQVRDGSGDTSPTVTVDFTVAAVNDNPVGVDDKFSMYTNTTKAGSISTMTFAELTGNDTDVDNAGSDLTVGGVRNATNGTATMEAGQVKFVPTLDFNGTATFEYQVSDKNGGAAWATAFVTVAPPPNEYPKITVTYTNFYPTGTTPAAAFDIGEAQWTIGDDGDTGAATVTFVSGQYHVFGDPGPAIATPQWNYFTTTNTSWSFDVKRVNALDAFETTWRVTDDRGLQNTWHFNYIAGSGYTSVMDFTGFAPPVVLALHGGAPQYVDMALSKVRFDLNSDGVGDSIAWAGVGSAVLGLDLNGDNQISDVNEFTFTQYQAGAKTDLEGLRAFDTNGNGALDAGDARWAEFGAWEDRNADGQTQAGEYQTLAQLGIASIGLVTQQPDDGPQQVASSRGSDHLSGVAVMGQAQFTRVDGSTGEVHDAMFAFDTTQQAAEVRRQALLFSQFCGAASAPDAEALAFVPLGAQSWGLQHHDAAHYLHSDATRHEPTFA